MKVIITGATGFVGREIVRMLAEAGSEIIAVARNFSSEDGDLSAEFKNVRLSKIDITDRESLAKVLKNEKTDTLIHSAGLAHQFGETKKAEFDAVNVGGTANVAAAALKLGAKHLILIGSTAVYGIVPKQFGSINEGTATNPANDYAESKLAAEEACREICEAGQLPLTIFRLAPVIGEANVGNVARLIKTIDEGKFVWLGDGKNLKTLIYKRDVALACRALLENKTGGTEVFNLAAAPISMNELVGRIAARLDRRVFDWRIPVSLPKLLFRLNDGILHSKKINKVGAVVEKWLSDDIYSAEEIRRRYGFVPTTGIAEALERQVDWYRHSVKKQKETEITEKK